MIELHDKAQKAFHNYVLAQRNMRQQQHHIKVQLALSNADADLLLDLPKLSEVAEDDINNYSSHKSLPIMLAAKEEHKRTLRKQRAKWHELLMDESDSDDELFNGDIDEIRFSIKNLNFNTETNNYYMQADKAAKPFDYTQQQQQPNKSTIPKRERNQLKTTHIRTTVSHMMANQPSKSNIWHVEPFDPILLRAQQQQQSQQQQ